MSTEDPRENSQENVNQDDSQQEQGEQGHEENNGSNDRLGEKGVKALNAERKARKEAEKQLNDALSKIQEFEDSQKSETERKEAELQRLRDAVAEAEKQRESTERRLLAVEVASNFGISEMADRLQGDTREELEEDAKALKKLMEPSGPRKPAPVPQVGRKQGTKRSNGEIFKDFFESNFG